MAHDQYSDKAAAAAMSATATVTRLVPRQPLFADTTQAGKPKATYPNARAALQDMGLRFSWDEFSGKQYLNDEPLTDRLIFRLRQDILERYGFDPNKEPLYDAALSLCDEGKYDPLIDYLDSLQWDKQPRLETMLHWYCGANDSALNSAIGTAFMVAAVRRARRPGTKCEFIPVLEGAQGSGKTTMLRVLAVRPEWYSDQELLHANAREQQEALAGKWIYELAELDGARLGDVGRLKTFASRDSDRARPAYGRMAVEQPRRCIFVGTTNESQYLRDTTGNRRFWPVKIGEVDLQLLVAERDQLWAEAVCLEAAGHVGNIPPELWGAAAEQQAARTVQDPWDDALMNLRGVTRDGYELLSHEACFDAIGVTRKDQTPGQLQRLHARVALYGWERYVDVSTGKTKVFNISGKAHRGYRRMASL